MNRRRFRNKILFSVLLLLLAAAPNISAQSSAATAIVRNSPSSYVAGRDHARAIAKEWLGRGIPGFSVTVARDGEIIYSEGFGYADVEQKVAAWPTTKFRIGSVSKPLTAVALVKLVEQGKLDLDVPIQKYVPTFPDKGDVITARMLAGHLAGIRHYNGDEFFIQKHYETVLDGLAIFQNDPLASPPGTKFNYSSYGFNLLSAAIEKACGEDFLSCMHELVFTPLGLRSTIEDQPSEIIEQRSRFYDHPKDKPLQNALYVDNSYKWAGGGFLSSTEDLVRFGSALLQPGYLKKETLALLFTSQKTRSGEETGYGMGFSVGKSKSGQKIYQHSGGSVGGTSQLIIYPDQRVVIAMICNYSTNGESWKFDEVQSVAEAFENK
ncbi:MAG TPA: serine hydrolase domain-containing protein [Candidatus Dormibacteraeota bacterium]|jgi:serine beta-lactamase-like protein LACTB|nr:serine hydrolase domain-containing protein [Candidatus Dormibacteraeota bacterium]